MAPNCLKWPPKTPTHTVGLYSVNFAWFGAIQTLMGPYGSKTAMEHQTFDSSLQCWTELFKLFEYSNILDRIALFSICIRLIFKTQTYSVFGPNLLFGPTLVASHFGPLPLQKKDKMEIFNPPPPGTVILQDWWWAPKKLYFLHFSLSYGGWKWLKVKSIKNRPKFQKIQSEPP